jgi:hypothetical protein
LGLERRIRLRRGQSFNRNGISFRRIAALLRHRFSATCITNIGWRKSLHDDDFGPDRIFADVRLRQLNYGDDYMKKRAKMSLMPGWLSNLKAPAIQGN